MDRTKLSDDDLSEIGREVMQEERLQYSTIPIEQVGSLSNVAKIRYFRTLRVQHPGLALAQDCIRREYTDVSDAPLITIIGPPGVGKSAFAGEILRRTRDVSRGDADCESGPLDGHQ